MAALPGALPLLAAQPFPFKDSLLLTPDIYQGKILQNDVFPVAINGEDDLIFIAEFKLPDKAVIDDSSDTVPKNNSRVPYLGS